ncbi:hypothetical protein M885DRAFT_506192 [Pelagophyceae sp. CCMP2097]|nr:hypothetical protein M885DRAFT_506192 [Pelagophyceae sp. CCMP2097]
MPASAPRGASMAARRVVVRLDGPGDFADVPPSCCDDVVDSLDGVWRAVGSSRTTVFCGGGALDCVIGALAASAPVPAELRGLASELPRAFRNVAAGAGCGAVMRALQRLGEACARDGKSMAIKVQGLGPRNTVYDLAAEAARPGDKQARAAAVWVTVETIDQGLFVLRRALARHVSGHNFFVQLKAGVGPALTLCAVGDEDKAQKLALRHCVCAIAEGKKYLPYRDSKLTELLADSLAGASFVICLPRSPPSSAIGTDARAAALAFASDVMALRPPAGPQEQRGPGPARRSRVALADAGNDRCPPCLDRPAPRALPDVGPPPREGAPVEDVSPPPTDAKGAADAAEGAADSDHEEPPPPPLAPSPAAQTTTAPWAAHKARLVAHYESVIGQLQDMLVERNCAIVGLHAEMAQLRSELQERSLTEAPS